MFSGWSKGNIEKKTVSDTKCSVLDFAMSTLSNPKERSSFMFKLNQKLVET